MPLLDAYLELGGREDSEDGHTWGQQAKTSLRQRYGCFRVDKVLYCGGLKVTKLERFGMDIEVEDTADKDRLRMEGLDQAWVTDHLGLRADFVFTVDDSCS